MLPLTFPRPFVGDKDMEYAALAAVPRLAPLGAPISSEPDILPVGLAPSAVNSPEKITTLTVAGVVVEPAYVPLTELLVNDPGACGSPNPNSTVLSGTMKKAWLGLTMYATRKSPATLMDARPLLVTMYVPNRPA